MGCTSCSSSQGCDERKRSQRELFAELLARLYPERIWGNLDVAAVRDGITSGQVRRLRRSLAELLAAPTYFVPGTDDDLCHFVYVLCIGREPALVEVREGAAALDGSEVERITERYLRVAFSSLARLATVQEVEMTLEGDSELWHIREAPRAGVYEPALLARLRKLTAFLAASDITYCDFGLLNQPAALALGETDDFHPGGYLERYGEPPRLCNFLFFETPPGTLSHCFVSASVAPA